MLSKVIIVQSATATSKACIFNKLQPCTNYQFYAILFDVAGNQVSSKSLENPLSITTYDKVSITAFSYSTTSINVGQTTAAPTVTKTGTAKSGPTYTSSNISVATVASDGKVTGVSAGTATITIAYVNQDGSTATQTCSITVYEKVIITDFSYSTSMIYVGQITEIPTVSITGTAKSGPTYSSSNTSIATVNSDTGIVTGVAEETVIITISYTNYDGSTTSETCSLTINSPITYINCESITISGIPPNHVLTVFYQNQYSVSTMLPYNCTPKAGRYVEIRFDQRISDNKYMTRSDWESRFKYVD